MNSSKNISNKNVLKSILATVAIAISFTPINSVSAEGKENKDISEIGWSSRLSSMGLNEAKNIGQSYTFYCQSASEDLIHSPIWGTNAYTVNSGICSTAVHSGMITSQEGGEITVKLTEGKKFYTGSYKNSVTSQDHRGTKMSFVFVGKKISQLEEESEDSNQDDNNQSSSFERVMVNGVQRGVEKSIEKVIIDIFK